MKPLLSLLDLPGIRETPDVDEGVEVVDLTMRTAEVREGSLFFCVPGTSVDGHDLAGKAVAAGAVALVVERRLDVEVPQVVVEDVRAAMGLFADAFFERPSSRLNVLGVTGTNGKTTTTHLLQAILEAAGRPCGLVGTIGSRSASGDNYAAQGFTTPEAIDLQRRFAAMLAAGDSATALEVSSHALEYRRTRGTRFAAVGFTNLSQDHLDFHTGFEAYYLAKRKLFLEPGPEGQFWPAAVNCDDEWGSRLFDELVHADRGDVPVWGYTLTDMRRASVTAKYRLSDDGAVIRVESPVGDFTLNSRLRGRFNVENVLCAATMALLVEVTPEQIQQGLDRVEGVPGRFQTIRAGQPFEVIVDYAHTPDSLENVLLTARELCPGKLSVVFGCGGDRDRGKRPLMGRVALLNADSVFVTSDNPRSEDPDQIIAEILRGVGGRASEVTVEPDRRAAIAAAIGAAGAGDVVVIAGKGHEQGQVFADGQVPFDDATVAREALDATLVS